MAEEWRNSKPIDTEYTSKTTMRQAKLLKFVSVMIISIGACYINEHPISQLQNSKYTD